jgi:signal transduction histidine kinase
MSDFYKSLKIAEEIGFKQGASYAYNNIGNVQFVQRNYDEASNAYLNSLKISIETKDAYGMAHAYNNLGEVKRQERMYDLASEYYQKSLKIKENIGDKRGAGTVLRNIGTIYNIKGQYQKALSYYNRSVDIAEQIQDKKGLSEANIVLGALMIKLNQYDQSREKLNQALLLSKQTNNKLNRIEAYKTLALLDSTMGNFRSAYDHSRKEFQLNDSILNDKTKAQVARLKAQFDSEKKTKEFEKLKILSELQVQKSKQNNLIILSLTLFCVLIALVLWVQSKNRKKKLIIANNQLELKSIELVKVKAEERVRVQKNLSEQYHDILGYKLTSLLLMCENEKNNLGDSKNPLYTFAERVKNKLKDLAETSRSGIIALDTDTDQLENFISELRADLNDLAETTGKEIRFQISENIPNIIIEPKVKFNISAAMKEAINNSLKYANSNTVDVKIELNFDEFKILVNDSGIGLPAEIKKQHSYGLINMKKRMNDIEGYFSIESEPSKGTTVIFGGKFKSSNRETDTPFPALNKV